jgi:ribonuclease HII
VNRLVLSELHKRHVVDGKPLTAQLEAALRADPRAGALAILRAVERRRREHRSEGQRMRKMLRYESELWSTGLLHVAGVDEAGMSPLAGPVVAAAVVFSPGTRVNEVDDSKKLDAPARERLAEVIKRQSVAWGVGFVEAEEIDQINIYWAGLLAMQRAIDALSVEPQHLLLDARKLKHVEIPQQAIVKGDQKSFSIAAASILAKTTRDARMSELDRVYPGYGFAQHKGYPVKEHTQAIAKLGCCAVHRRSFGPVRQALGLPPLPPWPAVEETAARFAASYPRKVR